MLCPYPALLTTNIYDVLATEHAQPEHRASWESQRAHAPGGSPIPAPSLLKGANSEGHVLLSLSEFTREIKQALVAYSTDLFANATLTGFFLFLT